MPEQSPIEIGFQVYAEEGGEVFGAVRGLVPQTGALVVYPENAGDFEVPAAAGAGCMTARSSWTRGEWTPACARPLPMPTTARSPEFDALRPAGAITYKPRQNIVALRHFW